MSEQVSGSTFLDRHGEKWEVDRVFGCWLWCDRLDRHGYALLWTSAGPRQGHRAVYEALVGPIPEGKLLDHLCRRRNCVRPAHLEPVTDTENQLRRNPRYLARRTNCKNGHAMTAPIRTPEGGRLCRVCEGPERSGVVAANPADRFNFHPPLELPDPFPSARPATRGPALVVTAVDVEAGTVTVGPIACAPVPEAELVELARAAAAVPITLREAVGVVMRQTNGRGNPDEVERLVESFRG